MSSLALFTYDALTIRADPVYHHCLSKIQSSESCQSVLGDGILPGKLRSYRLDSGKFEPVSSKSARWRNPRIQMIFDVYGTGPPFRTAIVTAQAHKVSGSFPPQLKTDILKVDYEVGDEGEGGVVEGDRCLWIKGDEELFDRKSQRSGLTLRPPRREGPEATNSSVGWLVKSPTSIQSEDA